MFEGFYYTQGITYATGFAYEFALTTLVYGFSALAGSYLLYLIAILIRRTIKKRYTSVKPGEGNEEIYLDSSYNELHENLNVSVGKSKDPKRITAKVLIVLSHLVSWYALLAIAIAPSILSGLGVIPVWSSVIITFIIFLIKYVGLVYTLSPSFLNKSKDQANRSFCASFWRRIAVTSKMYKFTLGLFLAGSIVYSVLVPLATENTCMNFFNKGYGVMYQDFGLSTKFSRHFQIPTVCKKGKICHVYSTLPEDGSTSVILNVHTGVDVTAIQIGYQVTNDNNEILVTPQSFYIDMNEDKGNRYMHSAYLSGLTNNTDYTYNIYFDNKKQQSGQFRTLPSQALEREFTMAAGGDVGTTDDAKDMTNVLSNYHLDTILIGGDLGYDNGMKSCYYSLDMFLNFFEGLNEQAGRLIPLMVSVGNHDVGFNAFQGTQIDIAENLYFAFFPQHSATDANGTLLYQVPALSDRLSYAYHVIGNTVHLALDSAYVTSYESQVDFIEQVSTQYSSLVKFANFHVPMYPTCFDPDYDDPRTLSVSRAVWAPVFEKHKFMSIFENHVHLYKKSFPIVNGTKQDGGVVYFGDGNWGISPDSCWTIPGAVNGNNAGLLEALNNTRHIWLIDITKTDMVHYAVNETNGIFDKKYPLSVSEYIVNMDL